ncbi:MAG: periplasmic protein TonB [Bacteroidales bacterium]|jgi:protein TonB|nr:periplasmic protein TonB [Bacteroidales bacterium]
MPYKKEKKFIDLPRYSGGKDALSKFIRENLKYPKEALEAKVEGKVVIDFDVDDNGAVHNVRLVQGIGFGCDEEAMRIVSLLRYQKVRNRGRRVLMHSKLNIRFNLPQFLINYKIVNNKAKAKEPNKDHTISYIIKL